MSTKHIILIVLAVTAAWFAPDLIYKANHEQAQRVADQQMDLALSLVNGRNHGVTITKSSTDERGLTSVQFIQDGKEWGLDYLTVR